MTQSTEREAWIRIRESLTTGVDGEFFGGEYDKLVADERVQELTVNDYGVRLKTIPIVLNLVYDNVLHKVYMGKYAATVKLPWLLESRPRHKDEFADFKISCVHSGRYDGMLAAKYALDSGPGKFCFGQGRNRFVWDLINNGEFFALLQITLECLWKVNSRDVPIVVSEHRKLLPDSTIEPCHKVPQSPFLATPAIPPDTGSDNEPNDFRGLLG